MSHKFKAERWAFLGQIFAEFHPEGETLTMKSLAETLSRDFGQTVSEEVLKELLAEAAPDQDSKVDLTVFAKLFASRVLSDDDVDEDLAETFRFYDVANTGYITSSSLMHGMARLGCPLSLEEAEEMVREADLDGDGRLNQRDFRRVMRRGTEGKEFWDTKLPDTRADKK